MPEFIPGLKLSDLLYKEVIGPILSSKFPEVRCSAALIGSGSEVLGFDTSQSTDHHWGPRVQIFLEKKDYDTYAKKMDRVFRNSLPHHFRGYLTNFGAADEKGVRLLKDIDSGPVKHRVEIGTLESFFKDYLGVDPDKPLRVQDWLTIPQQRLLTVTAGRLYRDDTGRFSELRKKLAYYPRDVWLYLLASQWTRVSEEEAFVGRTGVSRR